jgi:hypothetical protein
MHVNIFLPSRCSWWARFLCWSLLDISKFSFVFLVFCNCILSVLKTESPHCRERERERESLSAFIFCTESGCITIIDIFSLRDVGFYLSEYMVFLCCYLNSFSWETTSVLPEQNNSWVGILAYGHFTTTLNIRPQFLPWLLV